MHKNLLPVSDKHPGSKLIAITEKYLFEIKRKCILIGKRPRHGDLYKLNVVSVIFAIVS